MKPIDIASRLELMVDDFLIDRLDNISLKLHHPQPQPLPASPLIGGYATVVKDGDRYRAWYRSHRSDRERIIANPANPEAIEFPSPWGTPNTYKIFNNDGNPGEVTCYAQSTDGIEWEQPSLGLHVVDGSRDNNVALVEPPFCHNFSPMLDARPGVPADERYKALAGVHQEEYEKLRRLLPNDSRYRAKAGVEPGGLWAFVSADGLHWRKWSAGPVIRRDVYAFDSQNVSFWSEPEGCYVAYVRVWDIERGWLRSVSRCVSADYLHWSEPEPLSPNDPDEHLYTTQTHPYFRAPHIYIATPTRFMKDRGASTDILFMTARGAAPYVRPFKEAWIRPGPDPERWGNRANYMALNVVPTSASEMSLYHQRSGRRYVLRTDGFASVNAGARCGEMITRPMTFQGRQLLINYSTAAAGAMQVELQTQDGYSLPGFSIEDCPSFWGDAIEHIVTWKSGDDLSALAGRPICLRFVMQDADLFALRFR